MSSSRERQQCGKEGQGPELADEAVEGALVEVLTALGQRQHEDDLEHGRRDGEHVGIEDGEV